MACRTYPLRVIWSCLSELTLRVRCAFRLCSVYVSVEPVQPLLGVRVGHAIRVRCEAGFGALLHAVVAFWRLRFGIYPFAF